MEQPPRKLSGKRIAALHTIWRAVLNKYSPKGNCVFRQRTISQVPVTDGAHTDTSVCAPVFKKGLPCLTLLYWVPVSPALPPHMHWPHVAIKSPYSTVIAIRRWKHPSPTEVSFQPVMPRSGTTRRPS